MKSYGDLIELLEEALAFLRNEDRQEPEEPKPLLTGPCTAKTRKGDLVRVQRSLHQNYPFDYRNACSGPRWLVGESGRVSGTCFKDDRDIVEVIRPLTDQEVLDWQFRGIEPELSVASERGGVVVEVFKPCELGRKEAEQMGLVHLGKATSNGTYEVNGTLYYFDFWYKEWKPKPGDYRVCEADTYAYKPAT